MHTMRPQSPCGNPLSCDPGPLGEVLILPSASFLIL